MRILLLMLLVLPFTVVAQKYKGEYINAAGDDGVSDTLFESITFRNDSFELRCITREALKASRKPGRFQDCTRKGYGNKKARTASWT